METSGTTAVDILLEFFVWLFSYSVRSLLLVNFFMTAQSVIAMSTQEKIRTEKMTPHTKGNTATAGLGFYIYMI